MLPRFTGFFKEFDAKLPLPTRMLLGFSDFTQQWALVIIGGGIAIFVSLYLFIRTDRGKL